MTIISSVVSSNLLDFYEIFAVKDLPLSKEQRPGPTFQKTYGQKHVHNKMSGLNVVSPFQEMFQVNNEINQAFCDPCLNPFLVLSLEKSRD